MFHSVSLLSQVPLARGSSALLSVLFSNVANLPSQFYSLITKYQVTTYQIISFINELPWYNDSFSAICKIDNLFNFSYIDKCSNRGRTTVIKHGGQ